jgi:SAM-dependent methyltransferase
LEYYLRSGEDAGGAFLQAAAEEEEAAAEGDAQSFQFPKLITSSQEAQFFDLAITNPGAKALALPHAPYAPLVLQRYPPGVPSLAAYRAAEKSGTFLAMERWAAAWSEVNSLSMANYPFHRDPLHAWSRRYEYVWAAEGLRAAIGASSAHPALGAVLEETWPDSPASPPPLGEPPFTILELDAQFTFFPQFLASRLGASVTALDPSDDFRDLYAGQKGVPVQGEPPSSATVVQFTPGATLVSVAMGAWGLPPESMDAIVWVGKLQAAQVPMALEPTVRALASVLKPGGRLFMTFNVGQPPIAMDQKTAKRLLDAFRDVLLEDVTHSAPHELIGSGPAKQLFTNHKARPEEFLTMTFGISAHCFIKV